MDATDRVNKLFDEAWRQHPEPDAVEKRRRVMRQFRLTEVSAVDKPAQEHATAVIIKRGDDKETEMLDMNTTNGLATAVEKVCATMDRRQIDPVVDHDLAQGCTVFSQSERDKMIKACLHTRGDVAYAKAITHPTSVKYLKWAMLPVHDARGADVAKIDIDALGPRKVHKDLAGGRDLALDTGFPNRATLTPRQVGAFEATDVNNPKSAMEQLQALADEQRKKAPWMTPAQAFAAVYTATENAGLAAEERAANRPGGASVRERTSEPYSPSMSSPGRLGHARGPSSPGRV